MSYKAVRALYLRVVGLIYVIAFASLYAQLPGAPHILTRLHRQFLPPLAGTCKTPNSWNTDWWRSHEASKCCAQDVLLHFRQTPLISSPRRCYCPSVQGCNNDTVKAPPVLQRAYPRTAPVLWAVNSCPVACASARTSGRPAERAWSWVPDAPCSLSAVHSCTHACQCHTHV